MIPRILMAVLFPLLLLTLTVGIVTNHALTKMAIEKASKSSVEQELSHATVVHDNRVFFGHFECYDPNLKTQIIKDNNTGIEYLVVYYEGQPGIAMIKVEK